MLYGGTDNGDAVCGNTYANPLVAAIAETSASCTVVFSSAFWVYVCASGELPSCRENLASASFSAASGESCVRGPPRWNFMPSLMTNCVQDFISSGVGSSPKTLWYWR